jgi:hypothetical protein
MATDIKNTQWRRIVSSVNVDEKLVILIQKNEIRALSYKLA